MNTLEWLVTLGFAAIAVMAFLHIVSHARTGVLTATEQRQRDRQPAAGDAPPALEKAVP